MPGPARPRILPIRPSRLGPIASPEHVVGVLTEAVGHDALASCIFGVTSAPDGPALRVAKLDGRHPSEALLGWRVPRDWCAVGFVATGTARGDVVGASARVTVVAAVDRHGVSASALVGDDGPLPVSAAEGSGRLPDLLRLSLGLQTPPPEEPVAELWSILWFDALLRAVLVADAPLTWETAAQLHPLCPLGQVPRPEAAGAAFAEHEVAQCTWEVVRGLVARGRAQLPGISAREAAWLDQGSFSRWVLAELPSLGQLAEALADLVPASLGRHLATVVTASPPVT